MPTPRRPRRWPNSSSSSRAARRPRFARWRPWGSMRARGRSWRARARRSRARWSARRRRCGPIRWRPIRSLYYSDSGPHIVQRGVPAARPSTLGKLELVSHGEYLRQAADSLERAPSATQRELRAHTLGSTFRALAIAGGGVLADRVAQFAAAAREAVASGIAVSSPAAFAAALRRAGDLLARSSTGDEEALATELDALTAAVRGIQPGAPAAPPPPARAAPVVPLARAAPPAPVPAPRVEQVISETPDLVGSWAAYQRLAEGGIGAASLAELVGGAQSAPVAPAPGSPGPSGTPSGLPDPAPSAVDVLSQLYRCVR